MKRLLDYYKPSPVPAVYNAGAAHDTELRRKQLSVFFAITIGYGFYYVCRLTFNVVKKYLADEGIFSPTELGIIGSALFFAYAFGKLSNGILADRINVRKFMTTGLLLSAVINLMLGTTTEFWFFAMLWGLNGWFQSFGAPSSVVAISRWYTKKEKGTFYGMWGCSHNIGEAITFIITAAIVSALGWAWGFTVAGVACLLVCVFIWKAMHESPEVHGLKVNADIKNPPKVSIGKLQKGVFLKPAIWILGLSSAFFYMTRYAINSWGIFFLEAEKGYTTIEAGSILSLNAIAGIFGTFFSGILSDKLFQGRRNLPALLFGLMYIASTALFVHGPANIVSDSLSMIFFGLSLGVLIIYLGGLMAVDIAPKEASGTALGIVGVASYIGAGLQDIVSGLLIDRDQKIVNGVNIYDFSAASELWIGAAIVSTVLALFVWNAKHH